MFNNTNNGVKPGVFVDNSEEVDYFMSLLTPNIIETIVQETNRYAFQKIQAGQFTPSSYLNNWKNTDISEIYVFLALMMLNSCNKKRDMKLQWSTDPLLHAPIFERNSGQGQVLLHTQYATFLQQCRPTTQRLITQSM